MRCLELLWAIYLNLQSVRLCSSSSSSSSSSTSCCWWRQSTLHRELSTVQLNLHLLSFRHLPVTCDYCDYYTPTGRLPCQTSTCSESFVVLINCYILNPSVLLGKEHDSLLKIESHVISDLNVLHRQRLPGLCHDGLRETCLIQEGQETSVQYKPTGLHIL